MLKFIVTAMIVVLLALSSQVALVDANSIGASNCPAGGVAISSAGASHAIKGTKVENGLLSKRGTTFAINGVNVKGGESFSAGTSLKWTLKTTDATYGMRGILIRVSHTGGDSFTIDSTQLKDSKVCVGVGVSGLTHSSSAVKKSVNGNMRFDKAGSVTVDITVVYRNSATVSVNGYTQYKFAVKASTPVKTPVKTPVRVPVRTPVRRPA